MKSLNEHIAIINMNEERVYGLFNDEDGKPKKLDKEILDIALKGLPKDIVDNIEDVTASGYSKSSMVSPPTVQKKGQARGENDYTAIHLNMKEPYGKSKMTYLTIGIRKRTSGPGTGYIAVEPGTTVKSVHGDFILPNEQEAFEFAWEPVEEFKQFWQEKIKKYI